MPPIKPGRWSANPADIDPRYHGFWRDLAFCIPLWETGSPPTEIVTKTPADSISGMNWVVNDYGPGLFSDDSNRGYVTWSSFSSAAFGVRQDADPTFTIAVLVRVSSLAGGNPGPISHTTTAAGGTNGYWAVRLSATGGDNWWFEFRDSGGTMHDVRTSLPFAGRDEWALVVITRQLGGVFSFYENGLFVYTETNAATFDTANVQDMTLQTTDSNGAWSIGDIAFIAGWDRVLDAGEVRQLWQDPFGFVRPKVEGLPTFSSLYSTADGTLESVVDEIDSTTDLYDSINDDPEFPDDTDWINNERQV